MKDNDIQIDSRLFNNDFDDVDWNPIIEDDSDNESAEIFGY